jgi:tungstate transport system substrate-binding protein
LNARARPVHRLLTLITIVAVLLASLSCSSTDDTRLRVATTTSLYDSGLWDVLEPMFEEDYGIQLDVMYAGTGKALDLGRRGDVQVVTVHSRQAELDFIAAGHGVARVPFAYNYFVIIGPPDDPAGIGGLDPISALQRLAEVGRHPFISRGDDSGTHNREQSLWERAGLDYETIRLESSWYIESGVGMGPTIVMANDKQAYTLSDIGTFLSHKRDTQLVQLVPDDEDLVNVYSAIAVVPEKMSAAEYAAAGDMLDFLTSPRVQAIIANFGVADYGTALFTPSAVASPGTER